MPANFTADIPETVTAAGQACKPRRRFGRSPEPRRFGGGGRHRGPKSDVLECIAQQLNVTNDSGVDETALDSLLDSLSTDTTFTDQLKTNADTCLAAMNATLTADQQGAYVLACLQLQVASDCGRQDENATLCIDALNLGKCPLGITSLVSTDNWRTCKMRGIMATMSSSVRSSFSGSFSRSRMDSDTMCPKVYEMARGVSNCSLLEEGLSSDDTVDLTAVQTAIDASSTTTEAEKSLQTTALAACTETAVDTFLACWAEQTAAGCVTSTANRLATGSLRGRGRFSGGSRRGPRRGGNGGLGARGGRGRVGGRRGIFGRRG